MEEAFKHSRRIGLDSIRCFVCAPKENNPHGLHLEFLETKDGAETFFTLHEAYQSYPGFLHGGIVSSILDETMGYVGVFRFGSLPLTRKLTISYRRGVEAGKEHRCAAKLVERTDVGYRATAAISLAGRGSFALAEADFILPTKEQASRLMPGADDWKDYFR